MTSAVHSALPKTDRHAPNAAHGGKSTKTGADFQRLLHGGTEHRRAEVKSDDTETRPDNAVASDDHDPVRAKFDEKAATKDSPADLTSEADPDQHHESTQTSHDGRSALDVLSSLISLNAADPSVRRPAADTETSRGEGAAANEPVTAIDREIEQPVSASTEKHGQGQDVAPKREPRIAQEHTELAPESSQPALFDPVESKSVARAPANDNPKVAPPAEKRAAEPTPKVPDHRTSLAAGELHPSANRAASSETPTGASRAPALPGGMATNAHPAPYSEQPEIVDARITVTESRQYPAPAPTAGKAVTNLETQQQGVRAEATSPAEPGSATSGMAASVASANAMAPVKPEVIWTAPVTSTVVAATGSEMPKPAARSENRAQPASALRTISAGGGVRSETAALPGHIAAKPATPDVARATALELAATKPEPMGTASADTAIVVNSAAGQPSDPEAQVRERPKVEAPAARTEFTSGINATPVPTQTNVTTGEALATSIADGLGEKKPVAAAANMPVPSAPQHQSAHVLKIELHPAELGAVTASLKVAGEQLSIEIQVENHEAYRRLSNDSDDLTNTLRKLGYDVDRITILQPQAAATPTSRTDAQTSSANTSSRDQSAAFSSSGQGGNGSGSDGQRSGRNPAHDAYVSRDTAPARRDGGRGGIVI